MKKNPPAGYREQNGCWNCAACRVVSDPETTTYTCVYGLGPQPKAPSKEIGPPYRQWERYWVKMLRYERGGKNSGELLSASVPGYGICSEWEGR